MPDRASRDVTALWRDYRRFVGLSDGSIDALPGIKMEGGGLSKVRAAVRGRHVALLYGMQAFARLHLKQFIAGEELSATVQGPVTFRLGAETESISFKGNAVEVFIARMVLVLGEVPRNSLAACPECGTFFRRVRRQIYCRPQCTDRATWRNYPAKKKRAARAKQYEKHGWALGARSGRQVPRHK
ncbi:MAG: hypothetical protein Q8L86_03030 [Vicinamibacterales bacterium]|nr:hypothetical protein [Vicinamibacterales bacterium]